MNPITKTIDKVEQIIGHSPHPAIVALPIGAWLTSSIADGLAIATKDTAYDEVARVTMAVGLVGAAAAAITGLHDYSYIPKDRQPSRSIATRHGLSNGIATSLFLASYVLRVRASQAKQKPSGLVRLLGLAGSVTVGYAGWLGGKLVEEQGEAVKPIIDQQNKAEKARKQILSEGTSNATHI